MGETRFGPRCLKHGYYRGAMSDKCPACKLEHDCREIADVGIQMAARQAYVWRERCAAIERAARDLLAAFPKKVDEKRLALRAVLDSPVEKFPEGAIVLRPEEAREMIAFELLRLDRLPEPFGPEAAKRWADAVLKALAERGKP